MYAYAGGYDENVYKWPLFLTIKNTRKRRQRMLQNQTIEPFVIIQMVADYTRINY